MDEAARSMGDPSQPVEPTQSTDVEPAARAPDLVMLDRVERELDDVERVLPRLDDGTYGTCEACGAAIGDERLAEAPAARLCVEHTTV